MITGWNLLSSAASFPMVLRYSSAAKHQDSRRGDQNLGVMTGKLRGQIRCRDANNQPGKLSRNSILTCGGTNQLKPPGKGWFNHLACINTPFCLAQVKQSVYERKGTRIISGRTQIAKAAGTGAQYALTDFVDETYHIPCLLWRN